MIIIQPSCCNKTSQAPTPQQEELTGGWVEKRKEEPRWWLHAVKVKKVTEKGRKTEREGRM